MHDDFQRAANLLSGRTKDEAGPIDETQSPTASAVYPSDPRKVELTKMVNRKLQDAYQMPDATVDATLEVFQREDFQDANEVHEMMEAVGQRYGYSSLRIPSADAYKLAIRDLRARAQACMFLRKNQTISPLVLYRRVPAFQRRMDPRILFEIYLDVLGYEKGKAVLEFWRERHSDWVSLQLSNVKLSVRRRREVDMLIKLDSYLEPEEIGTVADMDSVVREFQEWSKKPKAKAAADQREGDIITTLPGVMKQIEKKREAHDLVHHSGYPLIQLVLSFQGLARLPAQDIPEHLRSFLRSSAPLFAALKDLQTLLSQEGGARQIYRRSLLDFVDDMAMRHHFSKPLETLKRELKNLLRPEDARVVDPMFTLFSEDQLDVWNHVVRVTKLAYLLSLEMRLRPTERQKILRSALGHDWGKRDPDIEPLLKRPRKLTPQEVAVVAQHAVRSKEIARMLKIHLTFEPLVMEYHNFVQGATRSEEFANLPEREKFRFQRVLYVLYAADFLDAIYDYSRAYQRNRAPLAMKKLHEAVSLFERVLVEDKKIHGKDPIDPSIVASVRDAFRRIAYRSSGKLPSSLDQQERDMKFQETISESHPFWALYQLMKLEKQNYQLWNVQTYMERVLDRSRDQYFQRLWRAPDMTLETQEGIFADILTREKKVTQAFREFPLSLYMATVVCFTEPVYADLQPGMERIKEVIYRELRPRRLTSVRGLHRHVILRLKRKLDSRDPQRVFLAALMLGTLGGEKAIHNLEKVATGFQGPASSKERLAAVHTLGLMYKHLEKRQSTAPREGLTARASRKRIGMLMDEILITFRDVVLRDFRDIKTSPKIRQRVLYVLRNDKNSRTRKIAFRAMHDSSWRVRYLALRILGQFVGNVPGTTPNAKALRLVVNALGDSELDVRVRAQEILFKRMDRKVINATLDALRDVSFDGRLLALLMLYESIVAQQKRIGTNTLFAPLLKRRAAQGQLFNPTREEKGLLDQYALLVADRAMVRHMMNYFYTSCKKAIEAMSEDAQRSIWSLTAPGRAAEIWRMKKSEISQRPEIKKAVEEFLGKPRMDWSKTYNSLKLALDKTRYRKLRKAWNELRTMRRDFLKRQAAYVMAQGPLGRGQIRGESAGAQGLAEQSL